MNGADLVWVLVSTILVLLMVPGVGFLYGSWGKDPEGLATPILSAVSATFAWAVVGYSIAFGSDRFGMWGYPFGFADASAPPIGGLPAPAFIAFQGAFAAVAASLIYSGRRWAFWPGAIFIMPWVVVVYAPVAHWVWADGGWLKEAGAIDFAGGTVVHVTAGASVLACALLPSLKFQKEEARPVHQAWLVLGTALVWAGWLGFNGGSALGANESAALAVLNTNLAACAGVVGYTILSRSRSAQSASLGALAGLVAITPCAGLITPTAALALGVFVTVPCYLVRRYLPLKRDPMDVVSIHGVAGVVGALATGLLVDGGGLAQLAVQARGVLFVALYAYAGTGVLALLAVVTESLDSWKER
jgi:ammonium transporter, Amt family